MNWQSQIVTILFAFVFAMQQAPAVKAFRDYVPINNPYIKLYHRFGWILSALVIGYISPLNLHLLINCLWYWLVFDIVLNKATGKPFDYIGETAWIDKQLNKLSIEGADKALFIVAANIVLNIISSGVYAG